MISLLNVSGLVLVLVACAAQVSPAEDSSPGASASPLSVNMTASPSPSASPTPTVTPSPSPTPISRESVGVAFLDILDANNKIVCEANRAFASNDLEQWKTAARNIADSVRVRTDNVREVEFPPDLADFKQSYIAASATFEQAIRAQSAASTFQDWTAVDNAVIDANLDSSAAANLLRGELGLPSTPGSCEEAGY